MPACSIYDYPRRYRGHAGRVVTITELISTSEKDKIINISRIIYQQNVKSILFAIISIRLNVTFAVSRFSCFNNQSDKKYHHTFDRVLHYFYRIQNCCIRYTKNDRNLSLFVCESDISFVNNKLNRIIS